MKPLVGCTIYIEPHDSCYVVKEKHYEDLRDRLDHGETGWIELESVHGDGRLLCRLEHIGHLFHATKLWADERDLYDRQCKLTGEEV